MIMVDLRSNVLIIFSLVTVVLSLVGKCVVRTGLIQASQYSLLSPTVSICHFSDFHEAFERELDRLPSHITGSPRPPSRIAALKFLISRFCPKTLDQRFISTTTTSFQMVHESLREIGLVVFTGDFFTGSPLTYGKLGLKDLSIMAGEALRFLSVDFVTLGNHDIDEHWVKIDGLIQGFGNDNNDHQNTLRIIQTDFDRLHYTPQVSSENERLKHIYSIGVLDLINPLAGLPRKICIAGLLTSDTMRIAKTPFAFNLTGHDAKSYISILSQAFEETSVVQNHIWHGTLYNNKITQDFSASKMDLENNTIFNCSGPSTLRIVATHIGLHNDEEIVSEYIKQNVSVPTPQIILGGHSHTVSKPKEYPMQLGERPILVSHTGAHATFLGRLRIAMDTNSANIDQEASSFDLFNVSRLLEKATMTYDTYQYRASFINNRNPPTTHSEDLKRLTNRRLIQCSSSADIAWKPSDNFDMQQLEDEVLERGLNCLNTILKVEDYEHSDGCCKTLLLRALLRYDAIFLGKYRSQIEEEVTKENNFLEEFIGVIDTPDISTLICRYHECSPGLLFADALRWAALNYTFVDPSFFSQLSNPRTLNSVKFGSIRELNANNFFKNSSSMKKTSLITLVAAQPAGNFRSSVHQLPTVSQILKRSSGSVNNQNASDFEVLVEHALKKDSIYSNLYAVKRRDLQTILPYNNSFNIFRLPSTESMTAVEVLTAALFRSLLFHRRKNNNSSLLLQISGARFKAMSCHNGERNNSIDSLSGTVCAVLEVAAPIQLPPISSALDLKKKSLSHNFNGSHRMEEYNQLTDFLTKKNEWFNVDLWFKYKCNINYQGSDIRSHCIREAVIGFTLIDLLRASDSLSTSFEISCGNLCEKCNDLTNSIQYEHSTDDLAELEVIIGSCDWLAHGGDQLFEDRQVPITTHHEDGTELLVKDAVASYLKYRLSLLSHHTFHSEHCLFHDISLPHSQERLELLP